MSCPPTKRRRMAISIAALASRIKWIKARPIVSDSEESKWKPVTFYPPELKAGETSHPNQKWFPLSLGHGYLYHRDPRENYGDHVVALEDFHWIHIRHHLTESSTSTFMDLGKEWILEQLKNKGIRLDETTHIWVRKWTQVGDYSVYKVIGYRKNDNKFFQKQPAPEAITYLPEEKLLKRFKHCRLLRTDGRNWPYIATLAEKKGGNVDDENAQHVDLDFVFNWNADERIVVELPKDWIRRHQPILTLPTLHPQPGYYGFFKPTLKEVLSQLPDHLFDDVNNGEQEQRYLIETRTCGKFLDHLHDDITFIDSNYHLGVTKIYLDECVEDKC